MSDSVFYNTSVVVGPKGYVTEYRKRQLYYIDTSYAEPGNLGPISFSTPFGSFGLLICMDANYSESFLEYKALGLKQVIVAMDWDQDPNGTDGARPARLYFQSMAVATGMDIFASDVSPWDGSAAYIHSRRVRERVGLPAIAIGQNGVSTYTFTRSPARP